MPTSSAIAVVGATGVVGMEALSILHSLRIPADRVRALASTRSIGKRVPFGPAEIPVLEATPDAVRGAAVVLHCADAHTSTLLSPAAIAAGALVVDNSSAFRLDASVPLVVPEVNASLITTGNRRLIANPNCCVVILMVALNPLRRAFGIRSIQVSTYQAVSGAGQGGVDDLLAQTKAHASGQRVTPAHFHEPCALNVFSHDSPVDHRTGINDEERKIIDESRKIWLDSRLPISPTCVRVPVLRAHTLSIHVELDEPACEEQVRSTLASGEGVTIIDDRSTNSFPTPLKATSRDDVLVGRIRRDPAQHPDAAGRQRRWCLIACGDQLRKGAAGNAIQIARLTGGLIPSRCDTALPRPSLDQFRSGGCPVAFDPNRQATPCAAAGSGNASHGIAHPQVNNNERPAVQAFATECELVRTSGMPPEGLEPSTR